MYKRHLRLGFTDVRILPIKMVYTHVSRVWDGLIPFLKGLVRSVPRRNLIGFKSKWYSFRKGKILSQPIVKTKINFYKEKVSNYQSLVFKHTKKLTRYQYIMPQKCKFNINQNVSYVKGQEQVLNSYILRLFF